MNHIEKHIDLPFKQNSELVKQKDESIDLDVKHKAKIYKFFKFFTEKNYSTSSKNSKLSHDFFDMLWWPFIKSLDSSNLYDFKSFASYDEIREMVQELLTSDDVEWSTSYCDHMNDLNRYKWSKDNKNSKKIRLILKDFYKSPDDSIVELLTDTVTDSILFMQLCRIIIRTIRIRKSCLKIKRSFWWWHSLIPSWFTYWTMFYNVDALNDRIHVSSHRYYKYLKRLFLAMLREKDALQEKNIKDFKKNFDNIWNEIEWSVFINHRTIDQCIESINEVDKVVHNILDSMHNDLFKKLRTSHNFKVDKTILQPCYINIYKYL